ncbi:MAG: penicillin acylase family protein [Ignavibacteria bacterium]|nr:penicillin acylase family protein [Ignavibacteria bacterium]
MSKSKLFYGFLFVFTLTLIFSLFLANRTLKKSFPKLEGELSINGLKSDVFIYRDEFGIPYIEASNEDDLYFALGFVHAQDRLFQMDITRRAGMGKLSEVLGKDALEFDLVFKTIGFDELARKLYDNASEESKKICRAYTNGINSYLETNSGNYSIEFDLLNYTPKKWEPYQVYLIARLVAWELNLGWWVDVVYAQLQTKLSPEKLNQLIPDYPQNAPTIIPTLQQNVSKTVSQNLNLKKKDNLSSAIIKELQNFFDTNQRLRKFLKFSDTYSGSNSWAISSNLSKTGKPILANDPHLMYSVPSKWYIVSLNSPTLKVSGVTIPGSPSVVIGKNENIAWGLTNLMLDDCDFFVEQLDSSGSKYLIDSVWKNLIIKLDTIKIKNDKEIILKIKSTHRGPLIQSANKFLNETNFNKAISMKWTGYELSDELLAFYRINKAKSYSDFKEALRYFNCPAQNFLCADIKGNIFYKAAGKIPVRNYSNFLLLIDGTTSKHDWSSYLSFESLPEFLNPSQGFIATNNNPPTRDLITVIGNLWEPSSRAERINELLKSKKKFSIKDFEKIQYDLVSPYAKEISSHIVKAFENTLIKNKNLNLAINIFKNWNGELKIYSPAATVYNFFLIKLLKNTFHDELGDTLYKQFLFVGNVPLRIIQKLLNNTPPDSISLFDDINTKEIETKTDIIRKSMVETIDELEKNFGEDINSWQWGEIHQVKFKHYFSGQSFIVDNLIDIGPYPIGGDQTTLLNTSFKYYEPYENYLGPSMRQIVDLSSIDSSLIIITSGQSGHISHKNYKDQSLMWLNGEYIKFITHPEKFKKYNYLKLIAK